MRWTNDWIRGLGLVWGIVVVLIALWGSLAVWPPLRELAAAELIQESDEALSNAASAKVSDELAQAESAINAIRDADDDERAGAVEVAGQAVDDAQAAAEVLDVGVTGQDGPQAETTADSPGSTDDGGAPSAANRSPYAVRTVLGTWREPDPDSLLFVFVIASALLGSGIRVALANVAPASGWRLNTGRKPETTLETDLVQSLGYSISLPILASALALLVFYLIRAGLLGIPADGAELDQYAVGGLSALVGLGSDEVLERLKVTIQALFSGTVSAES